MGMASFLKPLLILTTSDSHVDDDDAVCFLQLQANGQHRDPSLETSSNHMPDVDLEVDKSPAKSASGEKSKTAVLKSSVDNCETNS